MPLREQAGERLGQRQVAGVAHGAGEEARIEQVQDRVLDAADVLVDRQPAVGDGGSVGVAASGGGETDEVPGRVDEGVHGVGLAQRRLAALRTGDVLPGRVAVERVARLVDDDVVGQAHRQVVRRHRHDAVVGAMDDGNRAAPVALARDAPVAQAVVDLALSLRGAGEHGRLEAAGDLFLGGVDGHAVEEIGIDQFAVADVGLVAGLELKDPLGRLGPVLERVEGGDDRNDRQVVLGGEVVVALVVRRAAEDGAGAVVHQHEVGDVNRQGGCRDGRDGRREAAFRSPSSRRSRGPRGWCRNDGTRR